MTAIKNPVLLAVLKGTTVGGALVVTAQAGCAAVYTGVGIVTLTLDEAGVDQTECHISLIPETILMQCNAVHTNDAVKVLDFSTGAAGVDVAAESAFSCMIWRIPATLV